MGEAAFFFLMNGSFLVLRPEPPAQHAKKKRRRKRRSVSCCDSKAAKIAVNKKNSLMFADASGYSAEQKETWFGQPSGNGESPRGRETHFKSVASAISPHRPLLIMNNLHKMARRKYRFVQKFVQEQRHKPYRNSQLSNCCENVSAIFLFAQCD